MKLDGYAYAGDWYEKLDAGHRDWIENWDTLDIRSMMDPSDWTPPRQSLVGTVLYGSGNVLKKDPADFNRNEKLTFIESRFASVGVAAEAEKFVVEIRCSRGLFFDAYLKAKDYGLYLNEIRTTE